MEASTSLIIRKAEANDTEAIHGVFASAIRGIGPQFYTKEQKTAWEQAVVPESWSTRMLELELYVAEIEGEVVGFVSWYQSELVHIYVSNEASGHGIGTALMHLAVDQMPGKEISLNASLNAAPFYEGFGFWAEKPLMQERNGVEIPCIRMRRLLVYP